MNLLDRSPYFLAQRVGRWRWPWVIVGLGASAVGFVLVAGLSIGVVELLGLTSWAWAEDIRDASTSEDLVLVEPFAVAAELLLVGLTFWGAAIAGSLAHRLPIRSLLAPAQPIRWHIVGKVGALSLLLAGAAAALELVALPGDTSVMFGGVRAEQLLWLGPMLAIVLVQTSGEDVFFKGLLLHRIGAATGFVWVAPILVIAIFVSAHIGNADFADLWFWFPIFVLSECMIIYFIIRTGGMEVALVLHWVNNAFIFFFVAEAVTQANELTFIVFETPGADAALIGEEIRHGATYVGSQILLAAALLWPRSPFYIERHVQPDVEPQVESNVTESDQWTT